MESNEFIRVYCRVRPSNSKESTNGKKCVICESPNIHYTTDSSTNHNFIFDSVFDENTSQENIFYEFGKDITDHCLQGYNGCIFAYGQTGSGKTYTILGPSTNDGVLINDPNEIGLLPRILSYMFDEIHKREAQSNVRYSCFVSFMEIYNEKIKDLINPREDQNLNILFSKLILSIVISFIIVIRENINSKDHRMSVENLTIQEVSNATEARHYVEQGLQMRRVGVTNMNIRSSRSHAIFTVYVTCEEVEDSITVTRKSQFHLIDLAGSERQSISGTAGDTLKEACYINSSLSAFGNVIRSLTHRDPHIPYRDSKLTFLLRDSLGGNSLTAIIATISPSILSAGETLSTLRFATDAKMIKNTAVVNEVRFGSVAALQDEIKRLQEEISQLKRKSDHVMTIENVHDCSFELSKCNKICSEMYYMNASLWREYYSLQQHYTHLQCELKLLLSLIERKKNSNDDNQSTYQLLLQIIIELLNEKESQSNNVLLLQQARLQLQASNNSSMDFPMSTPNSLISTATTIGDLYKQLSVAQTTTYKENLSSQEYFETWWKDEKEKMMNELEEYHSRCDELYADLLDCQEQLRLERMKDIDMVPSSKRPCLSSSSEKYATALLRMDCQSNIIREQRRIIAKLQSQQSIQQETNDYYNYLCSLLNNMNEPEEHFDFFSLSENNKKSNEEIEQLQQQLQQQNQEIDSLKYQVIELSTQLEKEKKARCEALVQSSERLEQLVSLQTRMRLDQQAANENATHYLQLEEQQKKLQQENISLNKTLKELQEEFEKVQKEYQKVQGTVASTQADSLVQNELNRALSAALQQKTTDMDELSRQIEEQKNQVKQVNEEKVKIQQDYQLLMKKKEELEKEVNDWKKKDEERIELQKQLDERKQQDERKMKEISLIKESISVVQTQIDKQRIDYEEQQKEIQTKKVDAIHQKNYIINQLKDENWKLIGKLELARKRMINAGLSTSDIDVKSEEMNFYTNMISLLDELKTIIS